MSLAVVRCPGCQGASRVSAEALGHMVGCPRCQVPFVAEEEVPVVQPVARPSKPPAPAARAAVPVAPPRRRPLPDEFPADPAPGEAVPEVPDPEHDPHLPPVAGLPVSVLVGLALLPFGVPMLWRVAPLITGHEAALSMAVPVALAVAASALCLGVVYTIDWTAATRIKGVLMLVGLAYLSAAGLFYLKKDLMDRVRNLGGPQVPWRYVESAEGKFKVQMPGEPHKAAEQPLPQIDMTGGRVAQYRSENEDEYEYFAASGRPARRVDDPDDWFNTVGDHLAAAGRVVGQQPVSVGTSPGREWTLQVGNGSTRLVRVFVAHGRVYYLSVQGRNVSPADELVDPFFRSFEPLPR